jgi:hypothetical protein
MILFMTLPFDRFQLQPVLRSTGSTALRTPEIKGLRATDFIAKTESAVPDFPPERT